MPDQSHLSHLLADETRTAYVKCLTFEGIPSKQHSYYVLRANQFIKTAGGQSPRSLRADQINKIFTELSNANILADWQFGQLVDAVRILLSTYLNSTACQNMDWSFWKASARTVSGDHATTAKDHTPDELLYLKASKGTGEHAKIRTQHRELIVRFVTEIRARGYAYRTEETYEQWVVRYIAFCKGESPEKTGAEHVTRFLHELVVFSNVSASTQNQALNALVFLYKQVLRLPLGKLENFAHSKRKKILPVVMSRAEVKSLLAELDGWQKDVASLLYGTGMRVMEALTLRVKDIDFPHERILVRYA